MGNLAQGHIDSTSGLDSRAKHSDYTQIIVTIKRIIILHDDDPASLVRYCLWHKKISISLSYHAMFFYMDESVLLGSKPTGSIQATLLYIWDLSGAFSIHVLYVSCTSAGKTLSRPSNKYMHCYIFLFYMHMPEDCQYSCTLDHVDSTFTKFWFLSSLQLKLQNERGQNTIDEIFMHKQQ